MARGSKNGPGVLGIVGVILALGALVLISDPKFIKALPKFETLIFWLPAVLVSLMAVIVVVAGSLKYFRGDVRPVTRRERTEVKSTRTIAGRGAERDDSRYMPKGTPAASGQDDSRYQPKPTKPLLEQLRAIDWFQFEKLIALAYSATGVVTRKGGANPDGGIDLVLDRRGERFGIQCKHWKSWTVGVKVVREMIGAPTKDFH
jgi:hypothetical protein